MKTFSINISAASTIRGTIIKNHQSKDVRDVMVDKTSKDLNTALFKEAFDEGYHTLISNYIIGITNISLLGTKATIGKGVFETAYH